MYEEEEQQLVTLLLATCFDFSRPQGSLAEHKNVKYRNCVN